MRELDECGCVNCDWGLCIVFVRGYDVVGGRRGRYSLIVL